MFYSLIFGSDLLAYFSRYKVYPELVSQVDPNGSNIVEFSMLHNDEDIRALMLIKTIGNDEPLRTEVDFPIKVYNQMVQKVWYEQNATSN